MEKGVPIRSVSRSLAVLRAINRQGSMSMAEIARVAAVPYPTACRLVQTLMYEALIEREPSRKRYRPTAFVRALSAGFQEHSELVAVARSYLEQLTAVTRWPALLSTRYGAEMMVRDCTDAMTSQVLDRHYPGHASRFWKLLAGEPIWPLPKLKSALISLRPSRPQAKHRLILTPSCSSSRK